MAEKKEKNSKALKVFKVIFPDWWDTLDMDKTKKKAEVTFESLMGSSHKSMWEFLQKMTETGKGKKAKIADYEFMVRDPVIKSALELVAEDTFQISENAKSILYEGSTKIMKIVGELFDKISLEERIGDWAYSVPFYGEMPLLVRGEDDEGITSIMDSIHPIDFWRIDIGNLYAFMTNYEKTDKGERKILPPWEMVHFRYKNDRERESIESRVTIKIDNRKVYLENNNAEGYLESVRYVYKNLRLLEDSLVLARMDRAPLKRVFYIDVGDADPEAKVSIIAEFKKNYKKEIKFSSDQYYNSKNNPLTFGQELFIPISEGIKGIDVDEYGGKVDVAHIVDVEYWRQKLFAGLKTPKAFLGMEEGLPGSLGESALVRLEIRYARTVKANRRAILNGIFRLCQIECGYRGIELHRDDLILSGNYISSAEEEEKFAALSDRMDSANDFLGLFRDMGIDVEKDVNKDYLYRFVFYDLLSLTDLDIDLFFKATEQDEEVKEEVKDYIRDSLKSMSFEDNIETYLHRDKWLSRFVKIFPNDVKDIRNFDQFEHKQMKLSNRMRVTDYTNGGEKDASGGSKVGSKKSR